MPDEVRIRRAGADDAAALGELNEGIQRLHAEAAPDVFREPDPVAAERFFRRQAERDDTVLSRTTSG